MYIFDPATNRVKSAATLLLTRREQAEMVGITKYKCTVHFGIAKTVFLNSFFLKNPEIGREKLSMLGSLNPLCSVQYSIGRKKIQPIISKA